LSLLIYLPCLFAYLFVICWYSLNEMVLLKDNFLMLGRTACFRAFPHGYDTLSVCCRALLHRIHDLIVISDSHKRLLVRYTHISAPSHNSFVLQFAAIALDAIVGFVLVIVSTPSDSFPQYSTQISSPALCPVSGSSRTGTTRKFTYHTRYAYYQRFLIQSSNNLCQA